MDYEKLYKESLERAIYVKENTDSVGAKDVSDVIEYIFHGFKESEDEKIRKVLIDYFKGYKEYEECGIRTFNGIPTNDFLTWLEKQGERKEYTFKSLPRMLDMIEPTSKAKEYCQKLVDTLVKEGYFTDAKIVGECLKKMNGEDVPMAIMDEKQDEQKSADKGEPKFKVGDWITDGQITIQIEAIKNDCYLYCGDCAYSTITTDKVYHLWTIEDAKDGDVLQLGEVTAIFKKYIGNEHCICYCSFCKVGGFDIPIENEEDNVYGCYDDTTPANKEQRDTIMKAMSDAGYTFDFEKKDLKKIHNALEECEIEHIEHGKYYYCIKDYFVGGKKEASKGDVVQALRGLPIMALGVKANEYFLPVNSIKQNHAWSEEDERMYMGVHNLIYSTPYCNLRKEFSDWFKSLKERVQHRWKQDWSEDDKGNMLKVKCIIDKAWHNQDFREDTGYSTEELESLWNWFDNIWQRVKYPQNTWKPSEEQINALAEALSLAKNCGEESAFDLRTLHEQLKKLREE